MAHEIERKFLIAEPPDWLGNHPATELSQGYLVITGDIEVRLREADGRRVLTVKSGKGEVRRETEIGLDEPQFQALWPLTESARVAKRRHVVPLEGENRAIARLGLAPLLRSRRAHRPPAQDGARGRRRGRRPPWTAHDSRADADPGGTQGSSPPS